MAQHSALPHSYVYGLTCLSSCANGCLFKLCCTPCRVICKQCNDRYFKRDGAWRTSETINSDNQLVTRSLLIQPPLAIAADQTELRFENSTESPTRKTANYAVRYVPVTETK